jgi:hypothetical protein
MAAKKPASTPEIRRGPAKAAADRGVVRVIAAAAADNPNRLLREAAWIRMFGRIESKNPFTR